MANVALPGVVFCRRADALWAPDSVRGRTPSARFRTLQNPSRVPFQQPASCGRFLQPGASLEKPADTVAGMVIAMRRLFVKK
jgi:hypothetical protein